MSIAFIVGCARSGTSILGELIAAHPEVKYVFEAFDIWESAGPGVQDSNRFTAAQATLGVVKRVRRWAEQERGDAKLLLEKCPRNVLRVPFLHAIFPDAKIIHIVRDGRDVACSLVPGTGGKEWLHLKPPNWRDIFAATEGAIRCALAYKAILEIALDDLAPLPHLQIKYEDLVRDPRQAAGQLLHYLALPEHPAVKRFCGKIQDSTRDSYHAQRQVEWYRSNHQTRIGRWRENLSDAEAQVVTTTLAPLLRRLGYEEEVLRKAG